MKWLLKNITDLKSKFLSSLAPKKRINYSLLEPLSCDNSRSIISQFVGSDNEFVGRDISHDPVHVPSRPVTFQNVGNDENFLENDNSENEEKISIFSHKKFDRLNINESAILCLIYDQCKIKDDLKSDFISVMQVSELLDISESAARKLLLSFDKKSKIKCEKIRQKKFVYRQYELDVSDMEILSDLRVKKKETAVLQIDDISSSNINIININNKYKTTTKVGADQKNNRLDIPPDLLEIAYSIRWEEINFDPLKKIGFRKTQLKQLEKLSTPLVVQESINHFAWALENQDRIKNHSSPLNMLMGVLRKGHAWMESGYQSPELIALKQVLAAKEREKLEMDKTIDSMVEIELADWVVSQTQEQLSAIVPPMYLNKEDSVGRDKMLKKHFRENVLIPRLKKQEILR